MFNYFGLRYYLIDKAEGESNQALMMMQHAAPNLANELIIEQGAIHFIILYFGHTNLNINY